MAKLAGGVAVIRVGGMTEVEVKERKDRVDDALNATRAAVQEGIVVGGGVALIQAGKALDGLKGANSDQNAGIAIVRRALEAPLRQIAENAGVDGAVVAGKVRESNDKTFGFNAQTEEYGDMFKFGVIDPAKVVRTALEDAASVASLLITTEAMIADRPEPKGGAGWRRHGRHGRHGRHDVIPSPRCAKEGAPGNRRPFLLVEIAMFDPIRPAVAEDDAAVDALLRRAFGGPAEADLVRKLRPSKEFRAWVVGVPVPIAYAAVSRL